MDKTRKKRYNQKINELIDRLEFIEENIPADETTFVEDRILRKALYKEFQEAVEVMSDIAAMLMKDMQRAVEDDYTNIENACMRLGIESEQCSLLKRANGLRNVLVHEYDGVDNSLAYESIKEVLPAIKSFLNRVVEWLRKN